MRRIIFFFFLLISAGVHSQQLQWANGFNGTSTFYSCMGSSVAVDNSGNLYVTGSFDGTIDFDPGPSVHNLSSPATAVFLAKYDANGNYIWAFSIADSLPGYAYGNSLTTDGQGNILITGDFGGGPIDFDPGSATHTLTAAGNQDAFLAKYDASGNYLWAFDIGSFGNATHGNSVTCDGSNNVYLVGNFNGTVDFDPSALTANLNGGGAFMAKYTSGGTYSLAFNFPGSSSASSLAVDAGTIFITGSFAGTIDFDPGTGTSNLSSSGGDLFLAAYSSIGNYLWAFNPGCNGANGSGGVSLKRKGNNIYLCGIFAGSGDFDPGTGIQTLTANGAWDVLLAKYSKSGNLVWAKQVGSPTAGFEKTNALAMDQDVNGNLFVTGYFDGTTDFNPGAQVDTLSANNSNYLFVARYDSSGNYAWAFDVGSNGQADDMGYGICAAPGNQIYCTGSYGGATNDFDPGFGTYNLSGSNAMFVANYNAAPTGINNLTLPDKIKIFPIPASDFVRIYSQKKIIDFAVTTSQGEVVLTGKNVSNINVSALPAGPYFITVRSEDFVYREKLLIIR